MLFQKLELSNIGSFAGDHTVDFTQLNESGLFLLEGPTGSGKSTLLDSITFALYGGLAAGKDMGRLHSHGAAEGSTPSVTLTFLIRGDLYRITRIPAHERPKLRGTGTKMEATKVTLERATDPAGTTWTALGDRTDDVGVQITSLVGLDKNQFSQVALLPQGEFATFLKAKDDERRKVLQKLFDVALYDKVTDRLELSSKAARDQRVKASEARRDAQVLLADGDDEFVQSLDTADDATLPALLDARESDLDSRVAAAADSRDQAKQAHDEAHAKFQALSAQVQALTELTEALAALQAHDDTRQEFDLDRTRLTEASQAARLQFVIEQVHTTRAGRDMAITALTTAHASAQALSLEGDQTWPALASVLDSCDPQDVESIRQVAADTLASLAPALKSEEQLDGFREEAIRLEAQAQAAAETRAEGATSLAEIPAKIDATTQAITQSRQAQVSLGPLSAAIADLEAKRDAAVELDRLRPLLATKSRQLLDKTDEQQQATDLVQQLRARQLANYSATLAQALVDGEPCQVCGSNEHPNPAPSADDAVTDDDIASATLAETELKDARDQLRLEKSDLELEVAKHEGLVAGAESAGLSSQLDAQRSEFAEAQKCADRLVALDQELGQLNTSLEEARTNQDQAIAAESTARMGAESARQQLAARESELVLARAGHATVRARHAALEGITQAAEALVQAINTCAHKSQIAADAASDGQAKSTSAGFSDLDAAAAALLPADELQALETKCRDWETTLTRLDTSANRPEFAALDRSRSAELLAEHADLGTEVASLAKSLEAAVGSHATTDKLRTDWTANRDAFERELVNERDVERDTEHAIRLALLARGMSGRRRMTLTSYVLRQWFERVVEAANLRLARMSDGRYELARTDDGAKSSDRTGLGLSVFDRHTGKSRSTASLSGGETFYFSLSLALGLADVVKQEAGGMELNTLFIDEGFGTLDPDTLNDVMHVIDGLRETGRVIGIVSHVSELKETIAEGITIQKHNDSTSEIQLRGVA